MALNTGPAAPQTAPPRGLSRVLLSMMAVALLSAAGHLLTWLLLRDPLMLPLAGFTALMGGCLAGALLALRRGRLRLCVTIVCAITLGSAVICAALAPALMPVVVLLPVVAVVFALPYVDSGYVVWLGGVTLLATLLLGPLARWTPLALPMAPVVVTVVGLFMVPVVLAIALAMLWQFHRRLTDSLERAETANEALRAAQSGLEVEVASRTAALHGALAELEERTARQGQLLDEIDQQRVAIHELSVPVLPVTRDTLVLPLVGAIDSARIALFHEQALSALERSKARRLLIDVTGVPVIDTQVAQGLMRAVQASRLLGAEALLVGIRPEVAQTIVGLGLDLGAVRSCPDLETALRSR